MCPSLLILFTFFLEATAQCSTTKTVFCQTETGNGGETTVGCADSTHTLVSCGIRNDAIGIISKGTWMADNKCTIDYNGITTSTDITPYARCCFFSDCFNNFQCELSLTREKKRSPDPASCGADFPHLLSCGFGVHNIKQQLAIYFQNSGTNSNLTFDIEGDYLKLFGLPTQSPTNYPTSTPSAAPTTPNTTLASSNTTASPTAATVAPTTAAPSTPSPTIYAQAVNTLWFAGKTATAECVPQAQTQSNYTWLSSLCCTEQNNSRYTNSPSLSPVPNPTYAPTNATSPPSWRLSDIRQTYTYTTPFFPINASFNTSNEFEDFNNGIVSRITWGISNISRIYNISKVGSPGIIGQKDTPLDDWYFTIKEWDGNSATFTSQYGNAHIPNEESCTYCNCTQFRTGNQETNGVQRVVVYTNTTGNNKPKILGMTLTTFDSLGDSFLNYTCHVDMGRYNMSGAQIEATLSTQESYTLDYSSCNANLAGFKGSAHQWGIDYVGFHFIAITAAGSCAYADGVSVSTPSPTAPSLRPSPVPTLAPVDSNTTMEPTVAVDQFVNNNRELGCYYVMSTTEATCLVSEDTISRPQTINLTNPSFMTGCVGYSTTHDIKSWYIENNTCIVEGYDSSAKLAAIATCCTLVDQVTTTEKCGGTFWCAFTTIEWVFIILAIVLIVGCWIGALVWCIYAAKKQADQDALEKRLAEFETAENAQGEKVRILTEEQVAYQLDLERFKVSEEVHQEMVENERVDSSANIGLIE